MAGAQHVSTICLTYCLLSKGLWRSGIWTGSRSAGQVQSSRLLCAKTMAERLQLGFPPAALPCIAHLVGACSHHGVWWKRSSWACLRHRWGGITIPGVGCRNPRPRRCYCSLFILLAGMDFVLWSVSLCKLVTVSQTPIHCSFHARGEHRNFESVF